MGLLVTFLSLFTTSLCVFLKIPQILTLIRTQSADGLSHTAIALEFWCYVSYTCYNIIQGYSLALYLEYPPLILKNVVIFLLIFKYNPSKCNFLKISLIFTLVFHWCVLTNLMPRYFVDQSIGISVPLGLISKATQLSRIIRDKSAGSVSPLSWGLNALSSLSRFFSLILSISDYLLIFSLGASTVLNAAVTLAAVYYGTTPSPKGKLNSESNLHSKNSSSTQSKKSD